MSDDEDVTRAEEILERDFFFSDAAIQELGLIAGRYIREQLSKSRIRPSPWHVVQLPDGNDDEREAQDGDVGGDTEGDP